MLRARRVAPTGEAGCARSNASVTSCARRRRFPPSLRFRNRSSAISAFPHDSHNPYHPRRPSSPHASALQSGSPSKRGVPPNLERRASNGGPDSRVLWLESGVPWPCLRLIGGGCTMPAAATIEADMGPGRAGGAFALESEEEREGRIRALFDSFDSSKVGYLESTQIESGLHSLSFPFKKKYAVEMMEVCDVNRDGRIDYAEFRRYMDDKEKELFKLFETIDVSQDGALQPEELQLALSNSGVQLGDHELDAFIQYIDRDKNGKITFGEWRDFLLLYPREATLPSIYQYWEKVSLVDIGEQAVIPEGIGEHHQLRYLVAGAMAGAVSRTATAPLDRLKVMLAVQTHTTTATGIMHGFKHIYQQNGVAGFFRGNGLNVLKISPESAIKFYAYEIMKRVVVGDGKKGEIGTWGRLVAGGTAGAIAQAAIYPIDLVKTRLQCHGEPGRAPHLVKFTRDILVNEGPRALFRGLLPSLLGIIPYAGIDLATYETLKIKSRQYLPPDTEPGPFLHLCCGTFSGALGATCVYPLQLIRTRLQAQSITSVDRYTSMTDAFRRTFQHEGMRGFYKGLLPNMLKVVPSASITYLVYEDMKIRLSLK